jgi:hypothetical protein
VVDVDLLEAREHQLVVLGRDADARVAYAHRHPRPRQRVGARVRGRPLGATSHATATRPPGSVNFTAFDSRLTRICRTRRSSPT